MYNHLDEENIEMLHNGFPEDSAVYNPVKGELTCFYCGNIDEIYRCDSLDQAKKIFQKWLDRRDSDE